MYRSDGPGRYGVYSSVTLLAAFAKPIAIIVRSLLAAVGLVFCNALEATSNHVLIVWEAADAENVISNTKIRAATIFTITPDRPSMASLVAMLMSRF